MTRPGPVLLTCPDCSGILEPAQPAWTSALALAAAPEPPDRGPMRWHCPLCGYRVEATECGPGEPASPSR